MCRYRHQRLSRRRCREANVPRVALGILSLLALTAAPALGGIAAPHLVGFGADAAPGSTPCVVTTLADTVPSQPGQFRNCMEKDNVTVTFQTCGRIDCELTWIDIGSNIYVAGNTCPDDGEGITLYGCTLDGSGDGDESIRDNGETDVVLQGFTWINGLGAGLNNSNTSRHNCSFMGRHYQGDDIAIRGMYYSHLALMWGGDKTLSHRMAWTGTVADTIVADGIGGAGMTVGSTGYCQPLNALSGNWPQGSPAGVCSSGVCTSGSAYTLGKECIVFAECEMGAITMYRNLFEGFVKRLPKAASNYLWETRENVVVNWLDTPVIIGDFQQFSSRLQQPDFVRAMNFSDNYFIAGTLAIGGEKPGGVPNLEIQGTRTQIFADKNWGPWCGASATSSGTCATYNSDLYWLSEVRTGNGGSNEPANRPQNCTNNTNKCSDANYTPLGGTSVNAFAYSGGTGGSNADCQGDPYDDCILGTAATTCCHFDNIEQEYRSTTMFTMPGWATLPARKSAGEVLTLVMAEVGPSDRPLPPLVQNVITKSMDPEGDASDWTATQSWDACIKCTSGFCRTFGGSSSGIACGTDLDCMNDWTGGGSGGVKCNTGSETSCYEMRSFDETCSNAGVKVGFCIQENNGLTDGTGNNELCRTTADCSATRKCVRAHDFTSEIPSITAGTPWADTDSDGMEDAWEVLRFGNLNNSFDTPVTIESWTGPTIHYFAWDDYNADVGVPPIPHLATIISEGIISGGVID